jgi:hypothetical protein
LYKEVKIFQDELVLVKTELSDLKVAHAHLAVVKVDPVKAAAVAVAVAVAPANVSSVVAQDECFEDEDDNESVTSNEIKNILTNIHDDDDDSVDHDVHDVHDVSDVPDVPLVTPTPSANKACDDYSLLSEEELNNITYDKLRAYLRNTGNSTVGNKAELIKRTLTLSRQQGKIVMDV